MPRSLAELLCKEGYDAAVHTLELPDGNKTTDSNITLLATNEQRIVVTKDRDFLDSHLLNQQPQKLLLVITGNISNAALLGLFAQNISEITALLAKNDAVLLDLFGARST